MSRAAYRAPSTIEVIRLNLSTVERALAAGDQETLCRAVDAAESLFCGLRDICREKGVEPGPVVWGAAAPAPLPPVPDLEVKPASREPTAAESAGLAELQAYREGVRSAATAVVVPLAVPLPRPPGWRLLAQLTWQWWVCAGRMAWAGVRRLVRGGGWVRRS